MLDRIWSAIKKDPGEACALLLIPLVFIYAYGCESKVTSMVDAQLRITRPELAAEVGLFLARAEAKFKTLDVQDMIRDTIFSSMSELIGGDAVNPAGVAFTILNMFGVGAIIDNIRKRFEIKDLKKPVS